MFRGFGPQNFTLAMLSEEWAWLVGTSLTTCPPRRSSISRSVATTSGVAFNPWARHCQMQSDLSISSRTNRGRIEKFGSSAPVLLKHIQNESSLTTGGWHLYESDLSHVGHTFTSCSQPRRAVPGRRRPCRVRGRECRAGARHDQHVGLDVRQADLGPR
jgi:hypothetical protein